MAKTHISLEGMMVDSFIAVGSFAVGVYCGFNSAIGKLQPEEEWLLYFRPVIYSSALGAVQGGLYNYTGLLTRSLNEFQKREFSRDSIPGKAAGVFFGGIWGILRSLTPETAGYVTRAATGLIVKKFS